MIFVRNVLIDVFMIIACNYWAEQVATKQKVFGFLFFNFIVKGASKIGNNKCDDDTKHRYANANVSKLNIILILV